MLILNTVGPPTNGPYPTGEVALDSSGNGWYCQTAGTPGTWIGGGASTSITVVSNAVTVPIWATNVKLVNSSDANIAVTLSTTGAIDGQKKLIALLDYSGNTGTKRTITWTGNSNSSIATPSQTNGSPTSPLMIAFRFNASASTPSWQCVGFA